MNTGEKMTSNELQHVIINLLSFCLLLNPLFKGFHSFLAYTSDDKITFIGKINK